MNIYIYQASIWSKDNDPDYKKHVLGKDPFDRRKNRYGRPFNVSRYTTNIVTELWIDNRKVVIGFQKQIESEKQIDLQRETSISVIYKWLMSGEVKQLDVWSHNSDLFFDLEKYSNEPIVSLPNGLDIETITLNEPIEKMERYKRVYCRALDYIRYTDQPNFDIISLVSDIQWACSHRCEHYGSLSRRYSELFNAKRGTKAYETAKYYIDKLVYWTGDFSFRWNVDYDCSKLESIMATIKLPYE